MLNNIGLPGLLLVACMLLVPLVFWRIFDKAGYNGAWGLLSLVPGAAMVLLVFLAFATWPNERTASRVAAE
ncbi:hypothetical protein [Aliiroseovarius sp. YM-037]|uniref:hypothetical protein n=1 Tax=Aliiroseovarius sp. YM-037 TaxID=3341728 RepID=UPI003A812114